MLGPKRFSSIIGAVALVAATLIPGLPAQATASDSTERTASSAPITTMASQKLSWSWVDDSTKSKRTFRQDVYTGRENEIAVVVYAAPEIPQRSARLEAKQGGKWFLIDSGVTDLSAGEGRVTLYINPICQSGSWCRGTFKLRIKVVKIKGHRAAYKYLKVKFVPSATTPTTPPTTAPVPIPSPSTSTDCSIYPQGSMDWYLCMHDPTKDQLPA